MYLDILGWQQVLSSSFTAQFHAQRHQKLSISENDKTLWRHFDVIQSAITTKLSSNIAWVFIWSYAKFHVRSSSGFRNISQNVKGATLCPRPPPAARGLMGSQRCHSPRHLTIRRGRRRQPGYFFWDFGLFFQKRHLWSGQFLRQNIWHLNSGLWLDIWYLTSGQTSDIWPMLSDLRYLPAWPLISDIRYLPTWPLISDPWCLTSDSWPLMPDRWYLTSDQWPLTSDIWSLTSDQVSADKNFCWQILQCSQTPFAF